MRRRSSEQGRTQLEKFPLAPWAGRRRQDLLALLDRLNPTIAELTAAVEQEAKNRPEVLRLMTHPGVGPLTALAFVLIIGTLERFRGGKQIGSYVGLIPCEDSSAGRQRLGHISKQGNALLRFLLVEAAQAAARYTRALVVDAEVHESETEHSSERTEECSQKRFDRVDIVPRRSRPRARCCQWCWQ
jgi:transposase